ncbi:guanylate-binding protein 1 [Astyanax mexicanus]|uniref:guanylate-binding protein 1 n=1 Tax=Astyanax mexicanus TaxID=7994 RepID=UPI0020CAA1CF|nr:guanylate-binding protein 1 [Astyanax mexicanus]
MSGVLMTEPVCLVENINGSLQVSDSATEYLERILQPVVVVSVVGLYRTGKSYLMNRLAGQQAGFALGSTIESKTKGIWMWCVPHPNIPEHTLVLLDTEGLGDVDKGDSRNDAWIFCLAVLLSSTLVYNSRGTIDNTALEKLHYITELAEHIRIKSPSPAGHEEEEEEEEEDSQFVQFFPNFIWTVRDFILELVIENKGRVTEDEYLDFALQLKKGFGQRVSSYNLPRQCIRNYFPTRKCFVFPLPASQDNMARLESLDQRDLSPGFLKATLQFCEYVFTQSKVKTLKGGHRVSGRMFSHLVRLYVETICSGKMPCLENAVVVMAKIENQTAVEEGIKMYQKEMEQVKSLFPVSIDEITTEHQRSSSVATAQFIKHSFKDENAEYLNIFTAKVNEQYLELVDQNMAASERRCQELLLDLYQEMSKRLQQGHYAQPGGYQLYCTDRDAIITHYQSEPNKGVQAEEVLQAFLTKRSEEANYILQTDQILTEKEKRIEEEKERTALTERQIKVAEEKKVEAERALQVERERQADSMEQLERKFEEEKRLQQEEMNQAIQRKMAEQEILMKNQFKEKAELLGQEIQQLKKEKEESSKGFFKDVLMPLIGVGKDVLGDFLNYKIMRKTLKMPF